ncbi:hypothetical protein JCM10908_003776 [Rhodotorula pacifica]|uniref:lactonase family protein n=1 Tax=Rhodotorula pacifica TaxID=1495444 RepID=UPI003181DDCD
MGSYRLYAGGYEGKIVQLDFDPSRPTEERLKAVNEFACGRAPTWLTFSPDGQFVYSADEWGEEEGTLTSLRIAQDGSLEKLSTISTGGLWPCHSGLLSTTNPPQLLTTSYKGANVHCVSISSSGDLDPEVVNTIPMLGTGSSLGPIGWRQEQAHPHGAHPDPTGTVVVVPDLGTDDLRILHVDIASSEIKESEIVHLKPGDGPRHVLFGPLRTTAEGTKEASLYTMNELDNSLSVLRVSYPSSSDGESTKFPTFTPLQSRISLLPSQPFEHQESFDSWHSAELVLSPCGRFLLASNRAEAHDPLAGTRQGPQDLLAIFEVDDEGRLVEQSRKLVSSGGRAPRHMSFSSESILRPRMSDNKPAYLAVALHDSDDIVIFEFSATGELQEVARLSDVGRPGIVLWA